MAIQVLEHVRFEVRSSSDLDDFKQSGEAKMVIDGICALLKDIKATKQVFKPQIGADTFVKRMFVKDHGKVIQSAC